MTSRLAVRVEIHDATFDTIWMLWSRIFHENTTKILNFKLPRVFDSGLSGIAISKTCILHGRVLTKLVHLRQSYIGRSRPPSPGVPGPPPSAPRGRGSAGTGKSLVK